MLLVTIVGSSHIVYDGRRPRLLLHVSFDHVGLTRRRLHETNFRSSRRADGTHADALVVQDLRCHIQGLKVTDERGTLVKITGFARESKLPHFSVVGR